MATQILLHPYLFDILNTMELVSLAATSATLYLAAFFTSPEPEAERYLVAISIIIIVGNVGVIAWFAWVIASAGVISVLKQTRIMKHEEQHLRFEHMRGALAYARRASRAVAAGMLRVVRRSSARVSADDHAAVAPPAASALDAVATRGRTGSETPRPDAVSAVRSLEGSGRAATGRWAPAPPDAAGATALPAWQAALVRRVLTRSVECPRPASVAGDTSADRVAAGSGAPAEPATGARRGASPAVEHDQQLQELRSQSPVLFGAPGRALPRAGGVEAGDNSERAIAKRGRGLI